MTMEKSTCAVAPGVTVAAPVCTFDSANAMMGSVREALPSKIFITFDKFMISFLSCGHVCLWGEPPLTRSNIYKMHLRRRGLMSHFNPASGPIRKNGTVSPPFCGLVRTALDECSVRHIFGESAADRFTMRYGRGRDGGASRCRPGTGHGSASAIPSR